MSHTISRPGPPPISCITCRQRREKCDLSRPCCEMCLKGGYECLGYDDSKPRAKANREDSGVLNPCQIRSRSPAVRTIGSETVDSTTVGVSENQQVLTDINPDYGPKSSVLRAALVYKIKGPVSSANDGRTPIDPMEDSDQSWPQEQSQPTVYSRSRTAQSSRAGRFFNTTPKTRSTKSDLRKVIQSLYQPIPPSVDATKMMREDHFIRVISEYNLQRVHYWFSIPSPTISDYLVAQLKGSKRMLWTMYLGARLFQAVSRDSCGTMVRGHVGWIDKLDHKISTTSCSNPPLEDVADRFMVQLELAFLKLSMVDSSSGYVLLRKAVPKFLQLVAADTSLYTEHPSGNLVVSFPRTLCAPRYELQRFVIYDTIVALVLGVPPLVEYGYDDACDYSSHALEWIYGIPVMLVETISQINSWRADSRVFRIDWQASERHVLAWRLLSAIPDEVPATMNTSVTRAAVQESWQHVVLIYIYMGICGVSSHDSRVQVSVHRILQLMETVADLPIGIHMFVHCIVAGLAARLEKHRVLIHKMLLSFKNTRVWLFRGPQFGQVLYHLWHGVGAGGAPVGWDDYIRSRRTVAPI